MIETAVAPERISFPRRMGQPEEMPRRTCFSDLVRKAFVKTSETRGSVVMFSSPDRDSGVSYIASCVAVELAQAPERILLADARAIHLLSQAACDDIAGFTKRIGEGKVWVLGMDEVRTAIAPSMPGLSWRIADMLDQLRAEFTHIVIDGPAINHGKDAVALASAVDGVIFVAKAGSTEQNDLIRSSKKITDAGGRVLGSVLNFH